MVQGQFAAFTESGMDLILGEAKFVAPRTVQVALNDGGEIQAPMGRASIGGVITSTILTLVVVPVLYTYIANGEERRRARHAAPARGDGTAPAGADD